MSPRTKTGRPKAEFEGSPSAIIGFTDDGAVIPVNSAARKLIAQWKVDSKGLESSGGEINRQETLSGFLGVLLSCKRPRPTLIRKELKRPDCDERVRVELEVSPVCTVFRKSLKALVVIRDMTAREAAEEEVRDAERLAVAEQIAMGAAHEIRNPLTSIRGFIQILQRRISTEPEREYLNIMLEEVNRIDDLTGQMLMMSKHHKLSLKRVDFNEFLGQVCSMIEIVPDGPEIRIVKDFDPELPHVMIDTWQMKQAVLNVLKNAVEAMPWGGLLGIATRYNRTDQMVELRIADSGGGIPAEDLPHIFLPFFTRKENGTGLGLAATFGIIQSHDGRIEVESVPGQGTAFTITFPVSSAPEIR